MPVFCRFLKGEFENVKLGKVLIDYKSVLQEYMQQKNGNVPEYVELNMSGPPHDRTFECEVRLDGVFYGAGIGKSKQQAEKIAAEEALRKLKIID